MRFKQEIVESQVFDRLKFELGMKNFTRFVRDKLIPIPLDLVSDVTDWNKQMRKMLIKPIATYPVLFYRFANRATSS